ncbi:MAG: peptidylprolyl isomerase [Prevotella sp.]|nr:peptidylprolyl isomerase [Prevotella sp.]
MNVSTKIAVSAACVALVGLSIHANLPGTARTWTTDNDSTTIQRPVKVVSIPESSIIDEVIWVVGDEPILKSEVEAMRLQAEEEGIRWEGDPDCAIPEQLALQKLYLHQAAIDSVEVTESEVMQEVDRILNRWIQGIGSREKLEEYRKQSITQMRQEMRETLRDRLMIDKMKQQLVEDIAVSPADVRRYFNNLPEDSIPFVPTEVEVEILTKTPRIEQEEINRVKNELRSYTDRVTRGETSFATLARLYSEDSGSARQGGELDYMGRGMLDPTFANVAFDLTDPNKISKIVETEFGFHIIQLIDKRGDKIKCRHILLKPQVTAEAIEQGKQRLDSIAADIREGKFSFEDAATALSDDKDTRSSKGLMANLMEDGRTTTSKFRMQDLSAYSTDVARVVDTLKVGEVSQAFQMITPKGKTVCAIVKLKSRVEGHRATITEDFQTMKNVVLAQRRDDYLKEWVKEKLKNIYVRMNDRYKDCQFEYEGWIK